MKFGETFMEYLHGDQGRFLDKCSHVEYKRLKKVLKSCRTCRAFGDPSCPNTANGDQDDDGNPNESQFCQCQPCHVCDQIFFSELMKDAVEISGCFSLRVRHLLHLHIASGMHKYLLRVRQCFTSDQQTLVQEGKMLIEYITMNAIAMRKILKKYDKVHSSVNGCKFKSKMRAKHMEILQSPWLIELGAFCISFTERLGGQSDELFSPFSYSFDSTEAVMTFSLPDSMTLEYNLNCAICLELVFNPYALSCGHLFCKSCACSAASVFIFQGLKAASPQSKCPVCREAGVYGKAVHMLELDLLLKKRCKEYWKERMAEERAQTLKQSKEFWDQQTKYMIGY